MTQEIIDAAHALLNRMYVAGPTSADPETTICLICKREAADDHADDCPVGLLEHAVILAMGPLGRAL